MPSIYDYLPTKTPDYTTALLLTPSSVVTESIRWPGGRYEFDSGDWKEVHYSSTPMIYLELQWEAITPQESYDIMSYYLDQDKANGGARSFPVRIAPITLEYSGYLVCKFFDQPTREWRHSEPSRASIKSVRLLVLGRWSG